MMLLLETFEKLRRVLEKVKKLSKGTLDFYGGIVTKISGKDKKNIRQGF